MRNHKLSIVIIIFLALFVSIPASGQFGQKKSTDTKEDFKMQKRLFIGGWLGFGISSYSTSLTVAPLVGYRLSPSFDIGGRFNYTYYRYSDGIYKYSSNNYGLGIFGKYYLFFLNDLFLHAEYEVVNFELLQGFNSNNEAVTERIWSSALLVGGGYRQWMGSNAFVSITVLWNLLDDIYSYYPNPIFRIGVGVGI